MTSLARASAALALIFASGLAHGGSLEQGLAIDDAPTLRELDAPEKSPNERSFSLGVMLGASRGAFSAKIFSLPSMISMRATLDREFDDYAKRGGNLQILDRAALYASGTRFILAGIVNRMDRAYKSPATCGEIRLIYRPIANYGSAKSSRLPMTLNLVLNARNETERHNVACAEIARRWLALVDQGKSGAGIAATSLGKGDVLELVTPAHIDRIETNIQIARASANPDDFDARADYLMKVFKFDETSHSFLESPMENQIDRERILADAALASEFRQWLLAPDNFGALDKGMVIIPEKFLAKHAIVVTPAIASNTQGLFESAEIVETLAKASAKSMPLQNIKSPAGFERRLNDSTCAGCHQTRSIGGFHFPGVDWSGDAPGFFVTPASPHFFGDQPRRRDILTSFRDAKPLDFSRGFSARPQAHRAGDLDGTTFLNGWGAFCYAPDARQTRVDRSFASWSCIDGLLCQMPENGGTATRSGLCFPE